MVYVTDGQKHFYSAVDKFDKFVSVTLERVRGHDVTTVCVGDRILLAYSEQR